MKKFSNKPTEFSDIEIQDIITRYTQEESVLSIARSYNIVPAVIKRVLNSNGYTNLWENRNKLLSKIAKDNNLGKYTRTEEWKIREQNNLFKKGHLPHNKGKTPEEYCKDPKGFRENQRANTLKQISEGKMGSFLESGIHKQLKNEMQLKGIYDGFISEGIFSSDVFTLNVDEINYIKKIAIFVDGDFWHCNPRVYQDLDFIHPVIKKRVGEIRRKDRDISNYIKSKGFIVLRFWEYDIEHNLQGCIDIIKKAICG